MTDRRSDAAALYRQWYKSTHWQARRRAQLTAEPLCRYCKASGRITAASVADHITAHKGDWHLFAFGELQSLCKPCHDGVKQSEDRRGYSTRVDAATGWPVDPNHPANTGTVNYGKPVHKASKPTTP